MIDLSYEPPTAAQARADAEKRRGQHVVMFILTSTLLGLMWYLVVKHPESKLVLPLALITSPALLFSWTMVVWHSAKLSAIIDAWEQLEFVTNMHRELTRDAG